MINRYTVDPKIYLGKSMVGGGQIDKNLFFNVLNFYIDDDYLKQNGEKLYVRFNKMNDFANEAMKIVSRNPVDDEAIIHIMNIGNEERQNFIPREKAVIIVKECRRLQGQSQEGGGDDPIENITDNFKGYSQGITELMTKINNPDIGDDIDSDLGTNFLRGINAVPVLGVVFKFFVIGVLLLSRSIIDSTMIFFKILKVPIDIYQLFQPKELEDSDDDPDAYNEYRKLVLRLVGLYGKDTEYVLNLNIMVLRDYSGTTFRKYLHDPNTNAVFAYKLLKEKKSSSADKAKMTEDANPEEGDVDPEADDDDDNPEAAEDEDVDPEEAEDEEGDVDPKAAKADGVNPEDVPEEAEAKKVITQSKEVES